MSDTPLVARAADRPLSTRIEVGNPRGPVAPFTVGGHQFVVAAGPCSVEGRDMLLETARGVRRGGAVLLRGGAFKPRTNPYAFQGLGDEALDLLAEARAECGLAIVTECLDLRHADRIGAIADMIQVGARNMQNVPLLAAIAAQGKPVLLKRGSSATIKELLGAAEYLAVHGNLQVILCERGIRTFETSTRNTLDIAAIPVLKRETHLPVFVDPSHAAGDAHYVRALARAAMAAGADGLIVEVHPSPATALSDGAQSLTLGAFDAMMQELSLLAPALGRSLPTLVAGADTRRHVA
ncbi:MAG: 3-deoxy-7-phosphoheptulonate synthase [Gemmatimonadaceae bacterium]|nr:3-deoxy-7-phosphoheptulonate synthase [Gemmatimonadaceae bacterium]